MNKTSVLLLSASLTLGGCATPYGKTSLAGGYSEYQVNRQILKVDFFGNGYITADEVQAYTLYRCAELAGKADKPYFLLYDSLSAAARDMPSSQPRVGTLGGKPVGFAFISLLDQPRTGALATADLLEKLGPRVHGEATRKEAAK